MAAHKSVVVGGDDRNVLLRVPIDGRERTVRIEPGDAIRIGNQLATIAIRLTAEPAAGAIAVRDVQLSPYGPNGNAHLAFLSEDFGPAVFRLDPNQLRALATAAEAALEFAKEEGRG